MKKLILASTSPRRINSLLQLHIPFLSIPNNVNERQEIQGLDMTATETALYLSLKKAKSVSEKYPDNYVLALDTIIVIDNEIIGKPDNENNALQILMKLNNRWHSVITGVTLMNVSNEFLAQTAKKTDVKFGKHTEVFLGEYVLKGESLDKAGAYGIQSEGKHLVEEIRGDYTNVVGFPEQTVVGMLKKAKIIEE